MKKFISLGIVSLILIVFSSSLSAQITNKGNFIIGGTLGFSSATSTVDIDDGSTSVSGEGSTATQLNFAPAIGYFFANNFALGIGLDYTLNSTKDPIDPTDSNTEFSNTLDSDLLFGPFARYYFPLSDDKAFFVETTFGFGSTLDEFDTAQGTQSSSTNVMVLGIGPGFTIFSSNAIGIEALVKYNFARSNANIDIGSVSTEITTVTNQVDFSVGLQFYFARMQAANN